MARTGRPSNAAARLALLTRLAGGSSMAEIVREGPLNRHQVSRYVRSLQRDGLVLPDPHFSHLDADGGAALRFSLTPAGELVLCGLTAQGGVVLRGKSTSPLRGKSRTIAGGPRTHRSTPAGVVATTVSAHRAPPFRSSASSSSQQVFAGVHAVCVRFELEGAPDRVSGWHSRVVSGVLMRWLTLGEGARAVQLQLAADRTLTAKYRVTPDAALPLQEQPRDVERRKREIAEEVRRRMAKALRCGLSAPTYRGTEKWSVTGDPAGRLLRATGVALHGEGNGGVGLDDTPEEGTVEYSGDDRIDAVREHAEAMRFAGREVASLRESTGALSDRLLAEIAALRADARTNAEFSAALGPDVRHMTAMLRDLTLRVARIEAQRADGRRPLLAEMGESTWGEGRVA